MCGVYNISTYFSIRLNFTQLAQNITKCTRKILHRQSKEISHRIFTGKNLVGRIGSLQPFLGLMHELTWLERYSLAEYTHACMPDARLKNETSFTKETKHINIKKT